MLAEIVAPSNDFHAIAEYLVNGKGGNPHSDRVAWIRTQNLPTDDPELAAKHMTATARLSQRTKHAVYHMIIAWHEDERPTDEQMQEIAFKTLDMAGLAFHEALIMGHGDRPHKHLHMLINRVNPTTGRAWKTSHDFARFDTIMQQLSEEYGFRFVPSHTYNPHLTDDLPKKPNSKATCAAKRGANTNRQQWSRNASRAFGARMSEDLTHATSWEDIEHILADEGLTLEDKGKGLVIGDSQAYAKLSSLGLNLTANGLTKRFGRRQIRPRFASKPPERPSIFHVDEVDIARALHAFGLAAPDTVQTAVSNAQAARETKLEQAPLMARLMRNMTKATTGLTPLTRKRAAPIRKVRRSTDRHR